MERTGSLQVCATPIGNLGDVTLRVLETLRGADVIVAEDTRVTRKLLARHDIHTRLERYDEHTARERTPQLVERIAAGERIALVSDAGTPGVSDPGAMLVEACLAAGIRVDVLPGPSAILAALVASGLPTHAFFFGGFLPRKAGPRGRLLEQLASLDATLVFYESPRRTAATLVALAEAFPGRQAAMARELTKLHEEVARDEVSALAARVSDRELKGEVVLLVGPPSTSSAETMQPDMATVRKRVETLVTTGMSKRDAARQVAEETGMPRNAVFEACYGNRAAGATPPDVTGS